MVLELHFRSLGHRSPSGRVDISAKVEPPIPLQKKSLSLVLIHS